MGRNSIIASLRENFWIIGVNSVVRKELSQCITCRKFNGLPSTQPMAALGTFRVSGDEPLLSLIQPQIYSDLLKYQTDENEKNDMVLFSAAV